MSNQEIKEVFSHFDKDWNRYITKSEFIKAIYLLKDERDIGVSNSYFLKYAINWDGIFLKI